MKAGDDLRKEHDAILFALGLLEKMIASGGRGEEFPAKDAEEMVDFLMIFADKCHHGKEEGFLFAEYEKAGVARDNGPIGVMLREHEIGRSLIGTMGRALRRNPPDDGLFARATSAGAEVVMDLHDTDYGSRDFTVSDPEGNLWSFGTYGGE